MPRQFVAYSVPPSTTTNTRINEMAYYRMGTTADFITLSTTAIKITLQHKQLLYETTPQSQLIKVILPDVCNMLQAVVQSDGFPDRVSGGGSPTIFAVL
jgi:hypothetical protein